MDRYTNIVLMVLYLVAGLLALGVFMSVLK